MSDLEFTPQLAPTGASWTINAFHKYFTEDSLVIQPAFQRNVVWNDGQRSFLIDSVLRGMPIPEIYVETLTNADGTERVTVVDGQQRIVACLRFLNDELRLSSDEPLDARWRNRIYSELDLSLQQRFRSYELLVRKLPVQDEATLREIFRRLNKNVEALMPQELRHAAYAGFFIHFVEDVASSDTFEELGIFSRRDYLRRRSDELIAEVAYAVVANAFPNKKEGLDELFVTYEKQGLPVEDREILVRRFGRVLAQLAPMATTLRRTRFRNKSDFYSLFYVLATNAERLPLEEHATQQLIDRLQEFSNLVNYMKNEEREQRFLDDLVNHEFGSSALAYLRAVERAASDRLSRVRRNDELQAVLGPVLALGVLRPLASDDEVWFASVAEEISEDEEPESDVGVGLERDAVLRTIVNSD